MIPSALASVTTTASDDEFSMPTNNPRWSCASHFPPLAGLAGKCKIFSPNSRIVVLSFRPCSLCSGVLPSLPMSHLFTRNAAKSTSQHSILASGGTLAPMRCSQRSLQCSSLSHCTFDDPVGLAFTQLVVSPEPGFPLGDLVRVPSPVPQSPVHCRI